MCLRKAREAARAIGRQSGGFHLHKDFYTLPRIVYGNTIMCELWRLLAEPVCARARCFSWDCVHCEVENTCWVWSGYTDSVTLFAEGCHSMYRFSFRGETCLLVEHRLHLSTMHFIAIENILFLVRGPVATTFSIRRRLHARMFYLRWCFLRAALTLFLCNLLILDYLLSS